MNAPLPTDLVSQMEAWLKGEGMKYSCARGYGFNFQPDCVGCLVIKAVRELKADSESQRYRDALQDLCDEQNDAPLETRREQWQRAYDNARALLGGANG